MKEKNYRDGTAICKAIRKRVTFRCGTSGRVTCRGPDNIKRFYSKCDYKGTNDCALPGMVIGMRRALELSK